MLLSVRPSRQLTAAHLVPAQRLLQPLKRSSKVQRDVVKRRKQEIEPTRQRS